METLNIEERAKLALLGGHVHWKDTPIQITRTAAATDPLNFAREGWWKNAEPRDAEGREIIRLLESKGVINSADEFHVSEEWERRRDEQRHRVENPRKNQREKKVGVDDLELAPQENETISAWLARLAQHIDTNGGAKILWQGLQGYLARFRGDAKAKKSLDAKVVRAFLNAVN